MNGLVLLGDGKGDFAPQSILQSGFFVPGDAKALVKLRGANNHYLLAATQNKGPLKVFAGKNNAQKLIPLQPNDREVFITLANGKKRKEELYYGNSFLSQSSRFVTANDKVISVQVKDNKGQIRTIRL
jgi:hypothetical protein